MSLIINTDSYITLEDAKHYIQTRYLVTDSLRIMWEAADDESLEILLRRSYNQINHLPFTNSPLNKLSVVQHLQNLQYAQVELVLSYLDRATNEELEQRRILQSAGVTSYTIGDLSETFGSATTSLSHSNYFGIGLNAYTYLKEYLTGGYNICTSIRSRF